MRLRGKRHHHLRQVPEIGLLAKEAIRHLHNRVKIRYRSQPSFSNDVKVYDGGDSDKDTHGSHSNKLYKLAHNSMELTVCKVMVNVHLR
ncbi:hypothetical protein VNO77_44354 [Canavalia gladiata]|uniref:Uncharacterized protein n=1 Tax=Canavalia gladiata TaxID=3824 RepID=A0AAN9JVW1_CANGL